MIKHYVTFYSPGTFMPEETTKEIESWDIKKAKDMANNIVERYNSRPYGFMFTTRSRGTKDFDSKKSDESKFYFLPGGTLYTGEEFCKKFTDKEHEIARFNIKTNGINKIYVIDTPFRSTLPVDDKYHVVLD